MIHSGYGTQSAQTVPECEIEGKETLQSGGFTDAPLLDSKNISCELTGGVDVSDLESSADSLVDGETPDVFYPFDVANDSASPPDTLLNAGTVLTRDVNVVDGFGLVKAGVASPVDQADSVGSRTLSEFSFVIDEANLLSSPDVEAQGFDALRRHGVPVRTAEKTDYLNEWRGLQIDPNRPYLLVVAYYESLYPGNESAGSFRHFFVRDGSNEQTVRRLNLPKRHIRRVICRLMVFPPGFSSEAQQQQKSFDFGISKLVGSLSDDFERLKSWLASGLRSLATAPLAVAQKGGSAACVGMVKLDQLTSLRNVNPSLAETRVSSGLVLVVNDALRSRKSGIETCGQVSVPPEPVCSTNVDLVASGRCVSLPKMKLSVRDAEFLDLENAALDDREFEEYRGGLRVQSLSSPSGGRLISSSGSVVDALTARESHFEKALGFGASEPLDSRNSGLTRVRVAWDFESSSVSQ